MGIFYEQTEVINRTSKKLNVRFDGQDMTIEPNYDSEGNFLIDVHNVIPTVAVQYAKNQNVLMGSEDPLDPSAFEVLVAVFSKKGQRQRDDFSFCEQSDEPTPVKLDEYLDDPTLTIKKAGRRVKASDARPNRDTTPFEPRMGS